MLDWRSAESQAHQSHLSVFTCTDFSTASFDEDVGFEYDDYPWEVEVQNHIHELRPPEYPPDFLLVGYDDAGLAAVVEMRVRPLDRHCFISTVAVANRVSRRGLAGEAIDQVHKVLDRYQINADYIVDAWIDPRNWAAKSVFEKRGYVHVEMRHTYEVWSQKFA